MQSGARQDPTPGRLRSAWHVLMGSRLTPQQIQAEWVEYQQIFNDLLERWSAKLARDAKAEKERIRRLHVPEEPLKAPPVSDKQALRSKVAKMRGFGLTNPAAPEVRNESGI